MYLSPYIKLASTTYSPMAAMSRVHIPKRPDQPIMVNIPTGETNKKVKPKEQPLASLPKKGNNAPLGDWYSEFDFLHSFAPTVSGIGAGRRYWEHKKNPFAL